MEILKLESNHADIWIGYEKDNDCSYYYGGTRLIFPNEVDGVVLNKLRNLVNNESKLKNNLINYFFSEKSRLISQKNNKLSNDLSNSKIGGARCLIKPKSRNIHDILFNKRPLELFETYINDIFSTIGKKLNKLDGIVKLTPDFGRFAELSDYLYKHTEHVLGISCDNGGCGGKSSYSVKGIIGGIEASRVLDDINTPVTLIGSCGAMGNDLLTYLSEINIPDLAVCDLEYEKGKCTVPKNIKHLISEYGKFTDEALSRGGVIISTTWGNELIASNPSSIPENTSLILAHNYSLPEGNAGIFIEKLLNRSNIKVYPGQLLTLGGALTSRLEWYSRLKNKEFNKSLANSIAKEAVFKLTNHFDPKKSGKSIYNKLIAI